MCRRSFAATSHSAPLLVTLLLFLLLHLPLRAEEAPQPNYVFRAEVSRVVSGSTVEMNIDLGFGVWVHGQAVHLEGVTAVDPLEATGAEKEAALKLKSKLTELLKDRSEIVIQTRKDKTARPPRYMAVIWADGDNVNASMQPPSAR